MYDFAKALIVVQEAGAGALLASLIPDFAIAPGSIVLASPIAAQYFIDSKITLLDVSLSEERLKDLILDINPSVIITGASIGVSMEKSATVIANRLGIVVDAYIDHYWNLWQRFADPITFEKWAIHPNHIYVPELVCADILRMHGCPVKVIKKYDHPLLKINKKINADDLVIRNLRCRSELGIPEDAITALFVSEYLYENDPFWCWDQPSEKEFEDLLSLLLSISGAIDTKLMYVLVRCHPNESQSRWNDLCEKFPGAKWVNVSKIPKEDLFAISDLAFGLNSMLLLEASAFEIPVYSYHSADRSNRPWLSEIRAEVIELNSAEYVRELFNKSGNS